MSSIFSVLGENKIDMYVSSGFSIWKDKSDSKLRNLNTLPDKDLNREGVKDELKVLFS